MPPLPGPDFELKPKISIWQFGPNKWWRREAVTGADLRKSPKIPYIG
jgi:hypothetical protein